VAEEVDIGSPRDPVVTVILLTYNHERFIAQALHGVLAQKTPFAVELIVTEDHSTDHTLDVIDRVKAETGVEFTVLSSPVNLCSNVVFRRALDVARGEFVATLDGDDYWTDPQKLDRQVQHLRSRRDLAMSFHDVVKIDEATGAVVDETALGTVELTRCDLAQGNDIPGCSALIRRAALQRLPASFDDAEFGDWPLYLAASRHGGVAGIGATMGVYRLHAGGIWSGDRTERRDLQRLRFLDGLDASLRRTCRDNWRRGRGFAMRKVAESLLEQGRRWEAWPYAVRSIAAPGLPGFGRRDSLRMAALATSPRMVELVRRVRGRRPRPR
jgi:glycosyltransferase involved in cell wall biosynthesis